MTKEQLTALREWVQAEVELGIRYNEEDSEGYRGNAYNEQKSADRLFDELLAAFGVD